MKAGFARLVRLLRSLAVHAGEATFRFPAAALAICGIALIANSALAKDFDAGEATLRALLALTAGAAASVAATLLAESRGVRFALARVSGFLALGLVAAVIALADPFVLRGVPLTIAIMTIVPLAPFIGRGSSRAFWDFALWTGLGIALGWLSVLIFLLGFSAIFEMVRTLFGVGLGSRAYQHLFTTGLTFVGPLFALGRIPHPRDVEGADRTGERLERAVRPLFEWVSAPLVLIAGLIIHAYAAKIVFTGEVPTNEIGWIVLLYTAFVLTLRVGLEPYLPTLPQPARFFARFWALLLIVPLALFAYALNLRVGSEGWTVERYYSAAYGLAAAVAVLFQLIPKARSDVRLIVAVLPIFLLASIVGPWGAAQTVGRSQAALIASRYGDAMRQGGEALRRLDSLARATLLSRLDALEGVGGTERLAPLLVTLAGDDPAAGPDALRAALAEAAASEALAARQPERSYSVNQAWDVGGFDRVLPTLDASAGLGAGSPARLDDGWLVIRYRERMDRFDLRAALGPADDAGAADSILPALTLDLRSEEGRTVRIRLSHVRWSAQGAPISLQGWLALRHGEWAGPP